MLYVHRGTFPEQGVSGYLKWKGKQPGVTPQNDAHENHHVVAEPEDGAHKCDILVSSDPHGDEASAEGSYCANHGKCDFMSP